MYGYSVQFIVLTNSRPLGYEYSYQKFTSNKITLHTVLRNEKLLFNTSIQWTCTYS